MNIELRDYGTTQELYVDGILALSEARMGAREALEAISDLSREVGFYAIELRAEGSPKLFDDRFFATGRPRSSRKGA